MTIPEAGLAVTTTLVLRGATLEDGERVDVRTRGCLIESVGPPGTLTADVAPLDLSGYLLLPAPVEAHAHLDKAYTADTATNSTGDLGGAVSAWLRYRPSMSTADIMERAQAAVRAYVGHGATAIRAHIDVGEDIALRAVGALTAVRESVADACDLQVVAFVSAPLSGRAGAQHRALLREAMSAGADVVGGCPAFDDNPSEYIDICLDAAADQASPVDLHIDEGLAPDPCTLLLLADAVTHSGFPYGVAASHCVSLGMMPSDRAREIADRVAEAGIVVVCLPLTNLYLQGRDHPYAAPRGLTALRTLRAAGVTVAAGGDNLQDPFNCLGRADPLETAALMVLAGHQTPASAYAGVSADARTALGLSTVAIEAGAPAELLAIRAGSLREAVAEASPERVVIHAGSVVARTTVRRVS
jgi:cytosine deaminase